jgi:hypothetical protein
MFSTFPKGAISEGANGELAAAVRTGSTKSEWLDGSFAEDPKGTLKDVKLISARRVTVSRAVPSASKR